MLVLVDSYNTFTLSHLSRGRRAKILGDNCLGKQAFTRAKYILLWRIVIYWIFYVVEPDVYC